MLVPWAGQAKRLVPCRQLHGASAGVFGQGHGKGFEKDAVDVILWLLLCQAQRIDLHAVAEAAVFGVFNAVARRTDFVPKFHEGAHFTQLCHKADACVDKERDAANHFGEVFRRDLAAQIIENGCGCGQCEGELFLWRRTRLLQVVAAHVHRVPFGQMLPRIGRDIGDHAQRWFGRTDIGAAREVFFDDVVLDGALQGGDVGALLFGNGDIKREQPRRCRVDRHRRVHLLQRDIFEQRTHVAHMADGHADFTDFAFCQNVVAVISCLRR